MFKGSVAAAVAVAVERVAAVELVV